VNMSSSQQGHETAAPATEAGEGEFQPKIIAFCCNWCSYAGADLAGVSRLQMPTNFLVIRAMCSARVDPEFVLRAFAKGADGVLVLGCHPADCHYIGGNYRTRRRIALLKMLLEQYGLDPNRLQLEWVSASEGVKFQATIKEFTEKIRELGPNPLKEAEKEDPRGEGASHH
jgi:F420-non-reducing hydrogenase iron-sulfur subunit